MALQYYKQQIDIMLALNHIRSFILLRQIINAVTPIFSFIFSHPLYITFFIKKSKFAGICVYPRKHKTRYLLGLRGQFQSRLKSAELDSIQSQSMFTEFDKQNKQFDTSVNFDPDFSYINLIQDDPKYLKRSHLNVQSKIRRSTKSKQKCNSKKSKDFQLKIPSYSRKKSKTCERSPPKNKKIKHKIVQFYVLKTKKASKSTNYKNVQGKMRNNKSQKTIIFKKPSCQSLSKKEELGDKKIKTKLEVSKRTQRPNQIQSEKLKGNKKLKKTKSQTTLDHITLSQISKNPKLEAKGSKVIHQYFGLEDKLSPIFQKEGKAKNIKQKLSKCKTHSSSVSIKKQVKFKSSRSKK